LSDNLTKRGPQDRSRIALGEEHEIAYWTNKFRVSRDAIEEAVAAVGNSSQAVADFLGKRL